MAGFLFWLACVFSFAEGLAITHKQPFSNPPSFAGRHFLAMNSDRCVALKKKERKTSKPFAPHPPQKNPRQNVVASWISKVDGLAVPALMPALRFSHG